MSKPAFHNDAAVAADPQLERTLRFILLTGLALVLLLPAARGHSEWLGWLPMWLLAMPAMALWALHRFRLPAGKAASARTAAPRRRRPGTQARRHAASVAQRLPRAA